MVKGQKRVSIHRKEGLSEHGMRKPLGMWTQINPSNLEMPTGTDKTAEIYGDEEGH